MLHYCRAQLTNHPDELPLGLASRLTTLHPNVSRAIDVKRRIHWIILSCRDWRIHESQAAITRQLVQHCPHVVKGGASPRLFATIHKINQ